MEEADEREIVEKRWKKGKLKRQVEEMDGWELVKRSKKMEAADGREAEGCCWSDGKKVEEVQ